MKVVSLLYMPNRVMQPLQSANIAIRTCENVSKREKGLKTLPYL